MEIYGKKLNLVSVEFEQKLNRKRLDNLRDEINEGLARKREAWCHLMVLTNELPQRSKEDARRHIKTLNELEEQGASLISLLEQEYILQNLSKLESFKNELVLKSLAEGNDFLPGNRFRM